MSVAAKITEIGSRTRQALLDCGFPICTATRAHEEIGIPCCPCDGPPGYTVTVQLFELYESDRFPQRAQPGTCGALHVAWVHVLVGRCYPDGPDHTAGDAAAAELLQVLDCLRLSFGCCPMELALGRVEALREGTCAGWRFSLYAAV